MSVFALNLGGANDALGAALNGINNVNVGDIASQAAMGVLVGAMTAGIKGQLSNILPGLAPQTEHPGASPSGGPTATSAALSSMSPQAQAAFFTAGGHVIG